MLELSQAQKEICDAIAPLSTETIPVREAISRFSSKSLSSPIDLPAFDNSAMDGYALRASDVSGASQDSPIALQLAGKIAAGEHANDSVQPGTCVRIFTGSPLPNGADSVVMQEDTKIASNDPQNIWINDAVKPWENVRFRGEDIKANAPILRAGERISLGHLNLLAATGVSEVQVFRQPIVGLLATGSELIEAGQPLAPGKIYESNRVGLAALAEKSGAIPKIFPLVPDDFEFTKRALETAFAQCDVVVTSGGVSVGEFDFVKSAFEKIGGEISFWRVNIKPGKPFVFGRLREKFLFGVPGNPVSALVTFFLLVRPALLRLQGAENTNCVVRTGILAEAISNSGERPHFMRVFADNSGTVRSAGTQASHILSALSHANGLVEVPPKTTIPAGKIVPVLSWE